jgi:hypothetical protein
VRVRGVVGGSIPRVCVVRDLWGVNSVGSILLVDGMVSRSTNVLAMVIGSHS